LVALAAAYVLTPGAPDVPLNGMPIGQTGIVTLVLLIGTWLWTRRNAKPAAVSLAILLVALIAIKFTLATATPKSGWLARYYANESLAPPVERSIDFPDLPATRIDRYLALKETEFQVHFFNNREYNTGIYRETTLPFSVQWTGHVSVDRDSIHAMAMSANGRAEVLLDGVRQALITGLGGQTATGDFTLAMKAGHHVIDIRYQKPADTAPLLQLEQAGGRSIVVMDDAITPFPTEPSALSRRTPAIVAGWLLHLIART
jgi:hypothetical protein